MILFAGKVHDQKSILRLELSWPTFLLDLYRRRTLGLLKKDFDHNYRCTSGIPVQQIATIPESQRQVVYEKMR